MVNFKDWEEMWWFIQKYSPCSCLNCRYTNTKKDKPSKFVFCLESISMVDLNLMTVCAKWTSEDGETLHDYVDSPLFDIDDELLEKLEKGELTVTELRNEVG